MPSVTAGRADTVETVRGPVDLADLGPTLMHEHVFVLDPEALQNYGRVWGESIWNEEVRVADAIAKLRRLRDGGIHTIVDPTAIGLGRYIPRIRRVNAEVDLNIIVCTGVYAFLELRGFLGYRTDDQLVELFVREIREGIDDTGVKAAFLKCAVEEHGLVGDIPRILHLIAATAVETGVPVMVHTNAPARTGLLALDALTNAGVDPTRIVIAHAGDSNDLDYLRAIAAFGASLGCDRFNIEHFNPDERRIETLTTLVARGPDRSNPPRARCGLLLRLHGAQPAVRTRASRLPPHLEQDRPRPARGRRDAGADRRDAGREPAALLRPLTGGRSRSERPSNSLLQVRPVTSSAWQPR